MRRKFFIAAALLAVSQVAAADWYKVTSDSKATSYLYYPLTVNYPYAYPFVGVKYKRALTVIGWRYKTKSSLVSAIVDCRSGRTKIKKWYFYSGSNLNGHHIKATWVTMSNHLKVVPGHWYSYAKWPSSARKLINLACS